MSALEAAMRHNLFGLPLSAAWLALDTAEDQIILCYSLPRERLQPDELTGVVEALSVAVRELRHESGGRSTLHPEEDEAAAGNAFIRI
jgi:hypothetical protein